MMLSHFAERLGLWDYIAPNSTKPPEQIRQENQDLSLAQEVQKEEKIKYNRIKTQYDLEQKSMMNKQFAKWQRVKYYSKGDDMYVDAVVVGVHFDDGPDRPYYVSDFSLE